MIDDAAITTVRVSTRRHHAQLVRSRCGLALRLPRMRGGEGDCALVWQMHPVTHKPHQPPTAPAQTTTRGGARHSVRERHVRGGFVGHRRGV